MSLETTHPVNFFTPVCFLCYNDGSPQTFPYEDTPPPRKAQHTRDKILSKGPPEEIRCAVLGFGCGELGRIETTLYVISYSKRH